MRVCHGVTATFDDPNLVSCADLAPVLEMTERAGLQDLVVEHVRIDKPGGVTPTSRPVIANTRLRKGSMNSAKAPTGSWPTP